MWGWDLLIWPPNAYALSKVLEWQIGQVNFYYLIASLKWEVEAAVYNFNFYLDIFLEDALRVSAYLIMIRSF